jgi:Flp pilus assembly protein TadG
MAFLIVLLIFLLIGTLDFGRVFVGYVALINGAREGARRGVVTGNTASIDPAVRSEIQGNGLDLANLSVAYAWGGSGQPLVVTSTYRFDLITTSILPFDSLTLHTSAVMMIP